MRTISIKGVGKAKRNPDLVIFRISTSATSKDYADSVDNSNMIVNKIKMDFEKMGFSGDELKTVNYYTRPVYEDVEVGVINKRQRREVTGFTVLHDLKMEFDLDNDKINEVMRCLKKYGDDVDFNIQFSVRDKQSMKMDVILDATKNARFNAEALAEASSVELGDLLKIEYNWTDINIFSMSEYACNMDIPCPDVQFNPQSIEISDNVSFVWQIR